MITSLGGNLAGNFIECSLVERYYGGCDVRYTYMVGSMVVIQGCNIVNAWEVDH